MLSPAAAPSPYRTDVYATERTGISGKCGSHSFVNKNPPGFSNVETFRSANAFIVGIGSFSLLPHARGKTRLATEWTVASYASVKPVLDALAGELPPELKGADEGQWKAWAKHEDNLVRARLEQGALDSMVTHRTAGSVLEKFSFRLAMNCSTPVYS